MKHVKYIDIPNRPVLVRTELTFTESCIYHAILILGCIGLIGALGMGLYTMHLINSIDFLSIIK